MSIVGIKLIARSKVLNKKEKRKMIALGFCETICNSYKLILKLPFLIFAIPLVLIGAGLEYLGEFLQNISSIFDSPIQKIHNINDITFTQGELRDKLIAEIRGNAYKRAQVK